MIELVLVALIIAVLAAASIPRLSGTALRLRAEQAAFEMAQLLRLAHEQAVSEGRDATWTWDDTVRRVRVDPSGTLGSPLPGAMSVQVSRSGELVECGCVRFFPAGTSEAAAITVGPYTITVDAQTSRVLLQ